MVDALAQAYNDAPTGMTTEQSFRLGLEAIYAETPTGPVRRLALQQLAATHGYTRIALGASLPNDPDDVQLYGQLFGPISPADVNDLCFGDTCFGPQHFDRPVAGPLTGEQQARLTENPQPAPPRPESRPGGGRTPGCALLNLLSFEGLFGCIDSPSVDEGLGTAAGYLSSEAFTAAVNGTSSLSLGLGTGIVVSGAATALSIGLCS